MKKIWEENYENILVGEKYEKEKKSLFFKKTIKNFVLPIKFQNYKGFIFKFKEPSGKYFEINYSENFQNILNFEFFVQNEEETKKFEIMKSFQR